MRKPIMAGNWKMNKTIAEAKALAQGDPGCRDETRGLRSVPAVCRSPAVAEVLEDTNVELGAQNMHWEASGAFTGEVSAAMLEGLPSM